MAIPLDPRAPEWGAPPLPEWVRGFRPHQLDAIEQTMNAFDAGVDVVLMDAPTGCLAGDTIIGTNRGGNGRPMTMQHIVTSFNGGAYYNPYRSRPYFWDPDVPLLVQRAGDDGEMHLGQVAHAVESGKKVTYLLESAGGRRIRATAEHPFLTDKGFKRLGDLRVGDRLRVLVGQGGKEKQGHQKPQYRVVNHLRFHPRAGRRGVPWEKGGWSVPLHRLVKEAHLAGIDYDDYIDRLRTGRDLEGLVFLTAEQHVHHIDRDSLNNNLSNLEVLEDTEHHRRHAAEGASSYVQHHLGWDEVENLSHYGEEPTYDFTMLDAPNNYIANGFVVHNSGKSLIAEAIRRQLGRSHTVYVCHTKGLQDQYLRDFTYARLLKGRSNYPTADHPDLYMPGPLGLSCDDCVLSSETDFPACKNCPSQSEYTTDKPVPHCPWCHPAGDCPYGSAKRRALEPGLCVTNTAYLVAEGNGPGQLTERMGLCVIDECDTLESILMGQIEVRLSPKMLADMDLRPPEHKTVEKEWLPWLTNDAIPAAERMVGRCGTYRKSESRSKTKERKKWERLVDRLKNLSHVIEEGNAVYDGNDSSVVFKPVRVNSYAKELLWRHKTKWLLMTASLINPQEYIQSLGIEEAGLSWEYVEVPSTFPIENRPIHVRRTANMVFKEKETSWPKMVDGIRRVIDNHPGERTLIHAVSYDLSRYIVSELQGCGRAIYTYTKAAERDPVLEYFRQTPGAVLVAPSMDRGVDLPEDDCRVVIVAKIPFLNIRDKQVSRRMYSPGGQLWYKVQTVRSLVQMTGRGVRSATDRADTYILDDQFMSNIYKDSRHLLPRWWREALDFTAMCDS